MSIQDRDRKLLWGRAGNRCAMCRIELVLDAVGTDRASVIGQEAHIVARSQDGPRGGEEVPEGRDGYENLILVCPIDHKRIDDQPDAHTATQLRSIKAAHEAWVRTRLGVPHMRRRGPGDLAMVPPRLVNRTWELKRLDDAAEIAATSIRASVVVMSGIRGVGKTAVGAHWVHENGYRFGDQLVAALAVERGRTADVSDVLGDLLAELGLDEEAMPPTLAGRRRRFVELTESRKVVVLLDGADEPAQVAPFVPSGPGSMLIVTSNHLLEELVYDGAMPVPVDPLEDESATHLLVEIVGRDRVEAEPEAVRRLVELCGRLPLALRVSGAHLVGRHRRRSVAWVVDQIGAADDRLAAIGGSGQHDLAAVFNFAYETLASDGRALYRAIGLMPSARFAEPVARAVANLEADAYAAALAELVEVNLVRPVDGGRCSMHELVHQHARITGHRNNGPAEQAAGTGRLLDWYLAALRAADRAVTSERLRLAPEADLAAEGVPSFTDPKAAFAWFADERDSIQGVLRVAVDVGWDERVWHLTEPLWSFVYNLKSYRLWFDAYEEAARAGDRLGDPAVVARMRSCLARAYSDHGDFGRAALEMAAAERAVIGVEDTMLRGSVAEFSGIMAFERGDVADAVAHFQRARDLHAEAGSERGAALEQYQLGKCYAAMGSATKALEAYYAAEEVFVAIGDGLLVARVTRRKAEALRMAGREEEAVHAATLALAASQDLGLAFDEAEALELSALLSEATGHPDIARDRRRRAAEIYARLHHPRARTLRAELGEASGS